MIGTKQVEFGDYQTPQYFSDLVCDFLLNKKSINPDIVVEPTCGLGNFLESSFIFNAKRYIGIEQNVDYYKKCLTRFMNNENVSIYNASIFDFPLKDKTGTHNVLLIGNPPWVTNSTLSSLNSNNIPQKGNIKGLKGMDALTGASNFDICEFIMLQLITEYQCTNATLAMLCKTSVARNVFQEMHRRKISFEYFDTIEFDSKAVFNINASACLVIIKLHNKRTLPKFSNLYNLKDNKIIEVGSYGYKQDVFYSNLMTAEDLDFEGLSQFEWRQGVKHDNSKVMELRKIDGKLINGLKEIVEIEEDIVYPLIKSSMIKSPVINVSDRSVIVTQKYVKEETKQLEILVPKTWKYLQKHKASFENRKSSIYRNSPEFSMFGIGDYSYSKYKVCVSGFYKKPLFSLLYSEDKTIMLDDTTYFISFDNYDMAYIAMLCLNSKPVQQFLMNIAFLDAKRPFTKKVLKRIDFRKVVETITTETLVQTEIQLKLSNYITEQMFYNFKKFILKEDNK